jgi:hypothetical protein
MTGDTELASVDIHQIAPGQKWRRAPVSVPWPVQAPPDVMAIFEFSDARYVRWRRHSDGLLERVDGLERQRR